MIATHVHGGGKEVRVLGMLNLELLACDIIKNVYNNVGHWSSFSAEYDQEVVVGAQARTDIQFLEFRQNLEGSAACQLKVSSISNKAMCL